MSHAVARWCFDYGQDRRLPRSHTSKAPMFLVYIYVKDKCKFKY